MPVGTNIEFHDVANLFPMMSPEEFEELVEDIRTNGQQQPIWTYQGKIVDGRNRYKACLRAKVEPRFQEWDGKGSLVAFVVSLNVKRRHLTSSQLSAISLSVLAEIEKETKRRQKEAAVTTNNRLGRAATDTLPQIFGEASDHENEASQIVAKMLNTNRQYVIDAKKIAEKSPSLLQHVKDGTFTIPDAKAIANVKPEHRDDVLRRALQAKLNEQISGSKAVREAIISQEIELIASAREQKEREREQIRNSNRQLIAQAKSIDEVLGTAKFSTIVIDPPWDWGDEGDIDQFGRGRPVYGTMSMQELLDLPVGKFADENSHIYLWITNRSLPKGFALLDAWGFRYVTCITWVKPYFGMGNYFRGQTEHMLFGVKGSQPLKRHNAGTILKVGESFAVPRGPNGHSSKPLEAYPFIESCSPGPYLEIFARSERDDWTSWGAEV